MYPIASPALRQLRFRVSQALSSDSRRQVFLVGPEGRGKTTLLKSLMKRDAPNSCSSDCAFSYYDFQVNRNHNFQVMVTQWSSSLISQHPLLPTSGLKQSCAVFDDLRSQIPEMDGHLTTFLNRICWSTAYNYITLMVVSIRKLDQRVASHIKHVVDAKKQVNGKMWHETCQILRKYAPSTLGIKEGSEVGETESLYYGLYALGIIAEKVEIEARGELQPSSILTANWSCIYLLKAFATLANQLGAKWVLCLDGVDHLKRSAFLNDRGGRFLSQLISGMQTNSISSVCVSDDSSAVIHLVDERLSASLDGVHMRQTQQAEQGSIVDKSSMLLFDVPELDRPAANQILQQNVMSCGKIANALLRVSGGNMRLLAQLVRSYRDLEDSLDLPAVQQILAGSTSPVDDEFFPFNKSMEEQARYLQEERCKIFVRNLHNIALEHEIACFESSMNQFLSLPAMEEARHRLGSRVHFWVTVAETIRYLLGKSTMQLKPGSVVENRVVLSLIACGVLHLNLLSRTLEFRDALTMLLIESFIDNEYLSLPWSEQLEYKANYLLNQRTIYGEVDCFLL